MHMHTHINIHIEIVFVPRTTIHSQQHVLVMWSVAFYIRENFAHEMKDSDFGIKLLHVCRYCLPHSLKC